MTRRYLTIQEAEATLRRSKRVEIFLGGFMLNEQKCIRWASFKQSGSVVIGSLWEAFDQGSEDYVDIYTFESPSGEYDEPIKLVHSASIQDSAKELGISEFNFVNHGVVEDEYSAYLASQADTSKL